MTLTVLVRENRGVLRCSVYKFERSRRFSNLYLFIYFLSIYYFIIPKVVQFWLIFNYLFNTFTKIGLRIQCRCEPFGMKSLFDWESAITTGYTIEIT